MNIYQSIAETLNKQGNNLVLGNIYDMVDIWKSWYRGSVNDFHYYNSKLADGTTIQCERKTMNMAKKICEDYSKLLWSERTEISLSSKRNTKRLWECLDNKENNFSYMISDFIEKTFAFGTGCAIEYIKEGKTNIDFIYADKIIPTKWSNNHIGGLIAIDQYKEGKVFYTLLTSHDYTDGFYTKSYELYKSKSANDLGKQVSFEEKYPNVQNPYVVEVDTPHFQIYKPNIVNNFDLDSQMGISIFANSIDKLKAVDIKYDSFSNEFELGKKRILVDKTALKSSITTDEAGNITNVTLFDRNDKVYQAINGMESQPVKEIDFTLRVQEHISAINAELNYLSASVGLGQNYYDFDGTGVKTATEVISENSDTYRSKVKHQIILKDFLYDMIKSICYLEGIDCKEINIVFDDSIIEDKNAQREAGMKLVNAGLISKETFMAKYLEYDEDQIKEEQEKLLKDKALELLEANIIDIEKAIELVLGEIDGNTKARILANTGNVSFEEETPEEETIEEEEE